MGVVQEEWCLNPTEKLALWGAAHAAARDADRAVARQGGKQSGELRQRAELLRERADRLHREVYTELGSKSERAARS
ncbi:MAG: hypothetical protein AVDCRST_MAG51-2466 [uncultured Ramlibacter sp.]|uniref:Uncharacterized protein n=1 Tax=uncultured Ramlibacter sp. TaxID=260755 RepID=A0A6J4PZX2_9BURK|nr:MAG: hypothetical protein AVDCRST_MAG51-2466 [uncultured Ramlibacter sp.]